MNRMAMKALPVHHHSLRPGGGYRRLLSFEEPRYGEDGGIKPTVPAK